MTDKTHAEETGARLRELRQQTRLTAYDVAKAVLGSEDRYHQVLKWEAGKHTPRADTLDRLATFYGKHLTGLTCAS